MSPVRVWCGCARHEDLAAPVLSAAPKGGTRMTDIDGGTWEILSDGDDVAVRVLSPIERERLMGWPDDWTLNGIDDDGNAVTLPKTTRFKILGNGMVATVTEWIASRIEAAQ